MHFESGKNPSTCQWRRRLFLDISSDTPMEEGHISILRFDCPGLSPKKPMAISLYPGPLPVLSDGIYFIKCRAAGIYWDASTFKLSGTQVPQDRDQVIEHSPFTGKCSEDNPPSKWDIGRLTQNTNGINFSMKKRFSDCWICVNLHY